MGEKLDEFVDFVTGLVDPKKRPEIRIKKWHKTVFTGSKIQPLKKKSNKGSKKKSKQLTRTQFADIGLYNLPTKSIKYADLMPLHQLWLGYIKKQLQPVLTRCDDGTLVVPQVYDKFYDAFTKLLVKVDFHGAKIAVIASCNPSLVGQSGIIAMETRNTFKIVGKDNKTRSEMTNSYISILGYFNENFSNFFFRIYSNSETRIRFQNTHR